MFKLLRSTLPALLATVAIVVAIVLSWMMTTLSPVVAQQPTPPATNTAPPVDVSISIDATAVKGPLKPIYRFFGADEPNYAYMEDGLKLLGDIGKLGKPQTYFRAHSLMVTGDGTPALKWGSTNMYTEDAQGNPIYDWTIVDKIFDAYLSNGVKPYVQMGFMPQAMSTRPDPYKHSWKPGDPYNAIYTGWAYPPKDFGKWRELCFQWAKHCVEKYGRAEVEQWYWQTWNEANGGYWRGTPEDFRKLHDYAVDGVRRALPTARVGGPDSAGPGGQWTRAFLEHCLRGTNYATGQVGTPIDFVSFHAKGSPRVVNGHVQMGISSQLNNFNQGFSIVAAFPELKDKPIIIGESDPDGCAACTAADYPQNAYRNTELYASYTAATFARAHLIADRHGVNLEGALTWAFEFEDQPMFAGFRVMATEGGVTLPVFNVFRMFGKMSGQRVAVESSGEIPLDTIIRSGVRGAQADVSAMAAIDGNTMYVFAWHYHDNEVPGPDANVALALKNLPATGPVKVEQFRVDNQHSNAFTAWKKMGSPPEPTPEQFAQLNAAAQLQSMGQQPPVTVENGNATLKITLPRQSVSLMVLSW